LNRALADRPAFLELADRFAAAFVGGLLLVTLAAGAAWWYFAPERAFEIVLALLVVTCPCALSLAAPTAFAVALGKLAQHGLLLRSASVLERLRDVNLWMFDKTGTLTEGRMGVAHVTPFANMSAEAALRIAAALEAGIEHPIARALRATPRPHSPRTSSIARVRRVGPRHGDRRLPARPITWRRGRRRATPCVTSPTTPGSSPVSSSPIDCARTHARPWPSSRRRPATRCS
jgi:cation transport ATPase